jgi:putative sterol carrier protein
MKPKELFEGKLPENLKAQGDALTKINAIFQFTITGDDGGTWFVDCTKSGGEVGAGDNEGATCKVTMKDATFDAMTEGKISGQEAFMTGQIKLQGDMMLAMQLGKVLGLQ